MKTKLQQFIKDRRIQAADLRKHEQFAYPFDENRNLREESARTMEWVCDQLEHEIPELKN